jgi:hypothetical protein
MKNMWKERFEKCSRVLVHKSGSKMHEVFSILSEALIGFAVRPHRTDAETWVEELGNGRYKVVQEAPNAGQWAQGYRNESVVHVYKRGADTFLKLEGAKRLRVFDNEKDDGFVISSVARGYKVVKHSIEDHFLTWLAKKVEL